MRSGAIGRLDARTDQARSWSRRRPTECLALGLVLVVLGADLLVLSVRTSTLALGIAGVAVAVAGLTAINERVRIASDAHPLRWLFLGVVATAVGGFVVLRALEEDSPPAAVLGVLIAVVGLLPVSGWLRIQGESGRWWLAPAGLVLLGLGVWLATEHQLRWALGVGTVLGLTAYKVGVRRGSETRTGARIATWGGLALLVIGGTTVLFASTRKDILPGVAGAGLLVLGMMAMSVGWPKLGLKPFTGNWAIAFGLAVVAIGGFLAVVTINAPVPASMGIAALLAVVGGSFVWRGEALVVAVLIGASLVWLAVDRVDTGLDDPNPGAPQRILALGDSYISGEGAPDFFEGTNVKGPEENQCRRADTAFPYLVARDLGMGLDFYACSGAKAAQLHSVGQAPAESPDRVIGEKPQLDNLPADVSRVSAVLVSIGGNDAQFGDIGQGCVLPGTCDALRDVWLTNLDQIVTQISDAYEAIKRRLPSVPIVAIPYPLMLKDHSCSWSRLDDREHAFVSEFVVVLNDRVRVAAEKAGVHFFDGEMFAFNGAKICDGEGSKDTVMNFLTLNPVQGAFVERISPRNWIHGSLHPKPSGHERTAAVLTPWLRTLLAQIKAGTEPVNPPPKPAAEFTFRNVRGATPELVAEDDRLRAAPCPKPTGRVEPFASRVRLFDEASPFPVNARYEADVCFTGADGAWISSKPSAENPSARIANGQVYVQPVLPAGGGKTQLVVYQGFDMRWRLLSVDFCSRDRTCPTGVGDFQNEQLGRAARVAVPPILILILGGWLFALGTTRRTVEPTRPV